MFFQLFFFYILCWQINLIWFDLVAPAAPPIGLIAGVVVAVVVVIAVVAVLVLIIIRRRRRSAPEPLPDPYERREASFPSKTTNPVQFDKFAEHCETQQRDSCLKYSMEFEVRSQYFFFALSTHPTMTGRSYILPLSFFVTHTLISVPKRPSGAPPKAYERFNPTPNSSNWLRNFANPSPKFHGAKKVNCIASLDCIAM